MDTKQGNTQQQQVQKAVDDGTQKVIAAAFEAAQSLPQELQSSVAAFIADSASDRLHFSQSLTNGGQNQTTGRRGQDQNPQPRQ